MTEFEMATLAVQRMGVLVAALVGFSQCAFIGGGLFMMRRAAIRRDKALDELIRSGRTNHEEVMQNHKQFMKNHEESMAEIRSDREQNAENHERYMANHREAMEKHEENMAEIRANREQSKESHREAMAKHEESMAALHELIRRTSRAEE